MTLNPISGAKGKGGPPQDAPDSLIARSRVRIVDVVSQGEIEGWAEAQSPESCIFFDGQPLKGPSGDLNFEGVSFKLFCGGADDDPVSGFAAVETEEAVGQLIAQDAPAERLISDPELDAVKLRIQAPVLSKLGDDGALKEVSLRLAIDMQIGGGPWEERLQDEITGKSASGYQREYRLGLPRGAASRPLSVRVRRLTPDSQNEKHQDAIYLHSISKIIDARLSYPGLARIELEFDANVFGNRIPRRSYRLRGVLALVPSNYNPITRQSDGEWDGSFKRAWTDNPAWLHYTALIDARWGMGQRVDESAPNRYLYWLIAARCDELVDDGAGGFEPRFRLNGPLKNRASAFEALREIAATFQGMAYWGGATIEPVQDAPSDAGALIGNSSVEGGVFEYSKSAAPARKTGGIARYRDPANHHQLTGIVSYDDPAALAKGPRRDADPIDLPFITSRAQALRALKARIDAGLNRLETVSFRAAWDMLDLRPGDVIQIADKFRIGWRAQGRAAAMTPGAVEIDAPIELAGDALYTLSLGARGGGFAQYQLQAGLSGPLKTLPLAQSLNPDDHPIGAQWQLTSDALSPRLFRVVLVKEQNGFLAVQALEYDPAAYARVERDIAIETAPPYQLPSTQPPAKPEALAVEIFRRPRPGARAELWALISWARGSDARIDRWDIELESPATARFRIDTVRRPGVEVALADEGAHKVFVRARTPLGLPGGWAEHEFTAAANAAPPSAPTGAQIEPGANALTLLWDYPAEDDFDHVEVRASTGADVGAAQVVGRVDGASLVRTPVAPGLVWNHWLRTVTHAASGNISEWIGPLSGAALRVSETIELGELELGLLAEDVTIPVAQAADGARAAAAQAAEAETAALSARQAAEGAAASAELSRGVSARVSAGPSLLRNPYDPALLSDFNASGDEREDLAENTLYGEAGRSVRLTAAATDLGITALSAAPTHEFDSVNAAWLIVEVEFELEAGSTLSGAGVVADWINQGGVFFRAVAPWADAFDGPRRYTIQRLIQRPANYSGVWGDLRVHLMANWAGFSDAGLTAKRLRLDRIVIREATAAEIEAGAVPDLAASVVIESVARADAIEGVSAHYVLAVEANDVVSGFRLINAAAPNSEPASAFIIQTDRFSVLPPDRPASEAAPVFVVDAQTNAAGLNGDLIVDGTINARMLHIAPDLDGLLADGDHLDASAWRLSANASNAHFVRALSNGMGDAPGEGCIRMDAPAEGYVIAQSRRVRVTPGLEYRLEISMRTQSANAAQAAALAQLRWFALEGDAAHLSIDQAAGVSGAVDWVTRILNVQAPPGARWVELWELRNIGGAEWVAFSEARLRPLHAGETIISPGGIEAAQINVGELAADSAFLGALKVGEAQIVDAAITSAKIGALAVGSAQIENLSVGTEKIEAGALSSQAFAVTDAEITLDWDQTDSNIWVDLQSVTIDVYPGASVYLEAQFVRGGFRHTYREAAGDGEEFTTTITRVTGVRLLRNGVEVPHSFTETSSGREVLSRIDAPAAGATLYQFQIRRQRKPSDGQTTKITAARRSLSAIQFKK